MKKNKKLPEIGSLEEDREHMFMSDFKFSNKKIQNIGLAPMTTKIQKGLDILEQQGVLPKEEFKRNPNDIAERFLFGINCVLSDEDVGFSLLDSQTDQEEIQNVNIFDAREFSNLKASYIKTPDKFQDECDPFYNLDERMPENIRRTKKMRKEKRKPYLLKVASQASQINLKKTRNKKIRYFKDIRKLRKAGEF